mmetsp:Transcript_15415/g.23251  ORF Transcript_15415/g.23251 Transcript_15415/m.23251 type:complete len:552 (+) Transcript_15415:87-1742(+)
MAEENGHGDKVMLSDTTQANPAYNNITDLLDNKFWEEANWVDIVCEVLFHIKRRKTTIPQEVFTGIIQFISCMYVLPVVPNQLSNAGYDMEASYVVTAMMCAVGCFIAGLVANLPFIVAPPTAISIFLSIYLQERNADKQVGSSAVVISGLALILFGWRPLATFATKLVPSSIQVGTAVGIGILTALAGATDIDLVVSGDYTIVTMGKITPKVLIAVAGVIIIGIALHYHMKGAFCLAMCFGTIVWWSYDNSWPGSVASLPEVNYFGGFTKENGMTTAVLVIDLLFLYVLTLSGLVSSLSTLASLARDDNTTPRNRWLFVVCGAATCLSGMFSGPPILISPESASGIKGGARTGLSTVVCGLLFAVSVFFSPVLKEVPHAATAPLLIGVGILLFQNVSKLNWKIITDSMPAYFVLVFIPFTYSILLGVMIGYAVFLILGIFTGDIFYSALDLWVFYYGMPFAQWRLKSGDPIGTRLLSAESITSSSEKTSMHQRRMTDMDTLDNTVGLNLGISEVAQVRRPYFPDADSFVEYAVEKKRPLSSTDVSADFVS